MKLINWQTAFYIAIGSDQRIGATHISLYMALLHDYSKNRFQNPFALKRKEIMMNAKISSRVTYNKRMRELHDYGYINYMPSSTPGESQVNMNELKKAG